MNKNSYLSKKGYVLRKEEFTKEELFDIKKELRGRPLTDDKFTKVSEDSTFPIYIETKTKLYIPKMYGLEKFGRPKSVLENYNGIKWEHSIPFNGTLYERQLEPVKALLDSCNEKGGGILSSSAGSGKSLMTVYLLSELKAKAIIVVNKISLLEQWKSEIKKFLPEANVGIIQGQKNVDVHDKDIVVAMLQSLTRIDYPDELLNDFGVTVVDECFPYETNILTSNGNIQIGTLYKMKDKGVSLPLVKTFNEDTKTFEFKKIVNVFRKTNDNLIGIWCSKMKIQSTDNHKYLTKCGWKEANQITLDDYLISHYDTSTVNSVCPGLNSDQYQVVLGSFLGDGCIRQLKNGRYRLSMTHCEQQYDYCKWKASMFNINDVRRVEKNGYSKKKACAFNTKTFYIFNELPKTKTYVPQWILDDLDEMGLAIWFMDDGSINKNAFNSKLSTDSFDEDSQKRIVAKLNLMNITCKYVPYKKTYYQIVINEQGTKELIRLISKYIHKNMLYKLLTNQYKNYIQDNTIDILTDDTVFCKKENIKDELLIQNKQYKIYDNCNKTKFHLVKYKFCQKCNKFSFHNIVNNKYWRCYHTYKCPLQNMPLNFGEYAWNNKFLDYGFSKVTKIVKNIKNNNISSFVFDMEVEDNHNYIVSNDKHISAKQNVYNGFIVHNCHNTGSALFSKALFKLCSKYTIGLSATPTRADGCDYVFKWHIGDIVYKSLSERKGKPPIIRMLKVNSTEYKEICSVNRFTGQSTIQFTSMLSDLIEMEKRNKLIVEITKRCYAEHRKILVLSDRRKHLTDLKALLDLENVCFTYGLFVGSMKIQDLEKSKACNLILATYSAFSEGVSEKDLDTLILTTPKKFIGHLKNATKNESGKLEQIVGRIFRKDHTGLAPMIVDIQDDFSVYKNQSAGRKKFYKEHFTSAIFEDQSINLDEHKLENISASCINTKKRKEVTAEVEKIGQNMLDFCVIQD
jgi:superfamily II DNA or RNA helicase